MTRAVLLSSCGDPFVLSTCVRLWQERWRDEITTFYINYNNHNQIPSDVAGECISRLVQDPKVHLVYHPEGRGNGPPQVELLKLATEDLIMLLEDDFFLFTPGIVDGYFKKIESGETDLLGSPRYSVGEVAEAAKKKYNLDYSGLGDCGFGWWPTGLYCKRADLLKTDLDFGSKKYGKDEYFKELDHTFVEDNYTDTFTWTSVQLRYMALRHLDIPQYHADPYEIEHKEKKEMNWVHGAPPYIHGGSLSAGWNGYLSGQTPDVSNENAVREMETRCAFWQICRDTTEGFEGFRIAYQEGIENLIENAHLDRARVQKKYVLYREVMNI